MTREDLLSVLEECARLADREVAHIWADDALISFIDDEEVRRAFYSLTRWYG